MRRDSREIELAVSVVMPALNEAGVIGNTLATLPMEIVDRVWVADNGSSDGTMEEARAHGARVVSEPRRGYGAACQAAIAALAAEPDEVIVFIDADGSQPVDQLTRLLGPIAQGSAEFVVGIRSFADTPLHVSLGNRLACLILRLLTGHEFHDLGPFRAIRAEALKRLELQDRDYGWNVEMQARAVACGLRIAEVPVAHRTRTAGRSKISGSLRGTVRAGLKILRTAWVEGWRARRAVRGREPTRQRA